MISSKNLRNTVLLGLLVLALLLLSRLSCPIRASSPTLLISEVLYDPLGTEPDKEWIEIYNAGASTIDLSVYKVGDEETPGQGEGMLQFPTGASANPGQVIVIANKATAFMGFWGFNPDYEMLASDEAVPDMISYLTWAGGKVELRNGGDEMLILDGGDVIVDAMSYGDTTTFFNPACPDVTEDHSLERSPANADTDTAADWIDQGAPNPGVVTVPTPTPTATATPTSTPTPTPTTTPTPTVTIHRVYLPLVLKQFGGGRTTD
jgi:hypothetical protein